MRKGSRYFCIIFLFFFSIFFLAGCNEKETTENKKIKVSQEIEYMDTKIIKIANSLNNIPLQNHTISSEEISMEQKSSNISSSGDSSSQETETGSQESKSNSQSKSGNNEQKSSITVTKLEENSILELDTTNIDWKEIKNDIETLNESWGVILIDLSDVNASTDDILNFSSVINDSILSIKDENKKETLSNISKLYSYIPRFETSINGDNSIKNIKQIKSNLINSYALLEENNWAQIDNNIEEAEELFKNIMNDVNYIQGKEYKVNNTYVLLKELQNSLSYKDKKIFYIKYKNVMESINML